MGLNYSMMKVNKAALDKVTFIDSSESMNIQGIHLAGDVRIGKDDNFTLISQTPNMKDASGRCCELNPCEYILPISLVVAMLPCCIKCIMVTVSWL